MDQMLAGIKPEELLYDGMCWSPRSVRCVCFASGACLRSNVHGDQPVAGLAACIAPQMTQAVPHQQRLLGPAYRGQIRLLSNFVIIISSSSLLRGSCRNPIR